MVKKKLKKTSVRKENELDIPLWIVDGFNGLLALMIYNFILYLSRILSAGKVLESLEKSSGYFYLNSAITLGANKMLSILIIVAVFGLSFLLGIIVGNFVRRHRK